MSTVTALNGDELMDLVALLRQAGATISVPPSFGEAVYASRWGRPVPRHPDPWSPLEPLTSTEMRVLCYLPTHLTLAEIASELFRSVDTIRTHVRHIYLKLDAHTRSETVRKARAAGLLA